jgi:hypothetical protein
MSHFDMCPNWPDLTKKSVSLYNIMLYYNYDNILYYIIQIKKRSELSENFIRTLISIGSLSYALIHAKLDYDHLRVNKTLPISYQKNLFYGSAAEILSKTCVKINVKTYRIKSKKYGISWKLRVCKGHSFLNYALLLMWRPSDVTAVLK